MNTQMANQDDALKAAYSKMTQFANKQSTEILKETAKMLMNNYEDGAGLAFSVTLNVLESRMPEAEFVEFCDNL